MNKITIVLIVFILSTQVNAQDTDEGKDALGLIYKTIEDNNKAVRQNTATIKQMQEEVQKAHQRWLSIYLFGTGCFMLFLYSMVSLFSAINKKKNLKKTSEYIQEQNNKIIAQDENLFNRLKEYENQFNRLSQELYSYKKVVFKLYKMYKDDLVKQEVTSKERRKYFTQGMVFTIIISIIYWGIV